jgi:hypothetical protein
VALANVSIRGGGANGESVDDGVADGARTGATSGFGAASEEDGEDLTGRLLSVLPPKGDPGCCGNATPAGDFKSVSGVEGPSRGVDLADDSDVPLRADPAGFNGGDRFFTARLSGGAMLLLFTKLLELERIVLSSIMRTSFSRSCCCCGEGCCSSFFLIVFFVRVPPFLVAVAAASSLPSSLFARRVVESSTVAGCRELVLLVVLLLLLLLLLLFGRRPPRRRLGELFPSSVRPDKQLPINKSPMPTTQYRFFLVYLLLGERRRALCVFVRFKA